MSEALHNTQVIFVCPVFLAMYGQTADSQKQKHLPKVKQHNVTHKKEKLPPKKETNRTKVTVS